MPQPRIMFMEEEETYARTLQEELEGRGFPTACISSPEDEDAGLAFGPDLVVMHPEAGLADKFGLLDKIEHTDRNMPFYFSRSESSEVSRKASEAARARQVSVLGTIERPYDVEALAHVFGTPRPLRKRPTDGDIAHVQSLIASGRLIPNLTVEFQSKYDLATGKIAGHEALTRIATRRAINPETIFSQAVDLDVEIAATEYVIDCSARLAAALSQISRKRVVSFNCSAAVMVYGGADRMVREAAERHGISPSRLSIEITEEARLADQMMLVDVCRRLNEMKVDISIDDFGSGTANFDRIAELPFKELKIDKNIFWSCCEGKLPASALSTVIEFCHQRGGKAVIEGVENEEYLAMARDMGADLAQGFYWGKAVSPQCFVPGWR